METLRQGQFYDTHLPYLKLSGPPYEIGFRHGSVAKGQIDKAIEIYSALYLESKGVSWDTARSKAEMYLPLLQNHSEILDELQGIADGSEHDLLDILTLNVRSEITMVDIADGCTSLSQKDPQGNVYVGQNWDWIPEVDETTIWLEIEQQGKPKLLFLAEAGIIGKYGFNSEGVAIMLNAISANEVSYERLPIHFVLRKSLEKGSVNEILGYLNEVQCASCANLLMGDPERFCSVEVSPRGLGVIGTDENGVVFHTNHLIDPKLRQEFPCGTPILSSFTRYNRMKQLNMGSTGGYESFMKRLSDTENGNQSICKYPGVGAIGLKKCCTLYTIIINTNRKEGVFTLGRPADKPKQYRLFLS
jgi:isopenicillin-N N-acyltransferase-like protein